MGECRRPSSLFFCRVALLIFSRGYWEERNSEILAAQIHHLIRKRSYHLSRKIILAQEFVSSKRSTSASFGVSTRMSERLRTETCTVAWSDRAVLRRNRHPLGTHDEKRKSTASRLKVSEKNSENLAAQIHHLIRKRFCHLSRKTISSAQKDI